jgi:hypothetical protein
MMDVSLDGHDHFTFPYHRIFLSRMGGLITMDIHEDNGHIPIFVRVIIE